ncbi:MAG: MATE family efflux transporter [Eubacteriales bacterium]|nr:MATE family efflux transporter [Eubacteriales bacterium]
MNQDIFTSMPVRKAYMKLAIPVVMSMVITLVYNMVDTFFIARTNNATLVAGVVLCSPIFTLMIAIGDILGLGGSSVISRQFGMQKFERGQKLSAFCFCGAIVEGLIVAALLFALRTPVLHLLGADNDTLPYAMQYYSYLLLGAPFIILSFSPANILRTEGLAKESMFGTVLGAVINMILDPIFIFGLGLGAAGAAIATVIGYLCSDLFFLWVLLTKSQRLSARPKDVNVTRREILDILAIGIPASITNLMQSICVTLTNRTLLPYGTNSIAAMGIVMKVSMIATLILIGFAYGAQPLIGFNYGANNRKRLKEVLSFGYRFEIFTAPLFTALLSLAAGPILGVFMDDPEIVRLGVPMLRLQQAGMIFMSIVLVTTCTFQAAGKALGAFLLSVNRQGILFMVVLLTASRFFGYYGILASQAVSDLLTAILAVVLYRVYMGDNKNIS